MNNNHNLDRALGYFGGVLSACGVTLFIHAVMGNTGNVAPVHVTYGVATFLFVFGQYLLWV